MTSDVRRCRDGQRRAYTYTSMAGSFPIRSGLRSYCRLRRSASNQRRTFADVRSTPSKTPYDAPEQRSAFSRVPGRDRRRTACRSAWVGANRAFPGLPSIAAWAVPSIWLFLLTATAQLDAVGSVVVMAAEPRDAVPARVDVEALDDPTPAHGARLRLDEPGQRQGHRFASALFRDRGAGVSESFSVAHVEEFARAEPPCSTRKVVYMTALV